VTPIHLIIQELNLENGSNYKMDVLRKHADNELLQRVLKMTYDKVAFTYGITMKNVTLRPSNPNPTGDLEWALTVLEKEFANRNTTGNDALYMLDDVLWNLSDDNRDIVAKVLTRDLRINMGRSNINKVFKGLIVKPVYMRCGLFSEKTRGKINPEDSFVQLKADGTYREFTVENNEVICNSRSGESYDYPLINAHLKYLEDGHYIGELTVRLADGTICDRATGNGLIKSMDLPAGAEIVLDLWDYVTLEEYTNAANKIKGTTPYHRRFETLVDYIGEDCPYIRVIETHIVYTVAEALQHCAAWMEQGLEGAIWKDHNAIFRDGTSPQQLKLKLEIDADVRITGFKPGTVGTKREGKIGSIEFATDDGNVKGFASGFTDAELDDMDARREELMGQVMTVTCSDITRGRSNEYYALSHPRFVELRDDKTDTDTLERIFETKDMAMAVGG